MSDADRAGRPGRGTRLDQLLFTQGFGTRRVCAGLIEQGRVRIDGEVVDKASAEFDTAGLHFEVEGRDWPYHERALVVLNKPAGYECSAKPRHHPGVGKLLPPPLRQRGVQTVGRLDADTTGLLLLTDDGALIHRLTSPRHHVPKVYEITTGQPVDASQVRQLLGGVVLHDDPAPVRAAACEITGEHALRLTLVQGRYHQVKRMVAAVGNHVTALHRSAFGALRLPPELAPGQWAWVDRIEAITG